MPIFNEKSYYRFNKQYNNILVTIVAPCERTVYFYFFFKTYVIYIIIN